MKFEFDGKSLRKEADALFWIASLVGLCMVVASTVFLFMHPATGVVLMGVAFAFITVLLLINGTIVLPWRRAELFGKALPDAVKNLRGQSDDDQWGGGDGY